MRLLLIEDEKELADALSAVLGEGGLVPDEVATSATPPIQWAPLLTTNVANMPFDFVDYDVSQPGHPRKFYRMHQP